jgi:hypothetical protein
MRRLQILIIAIGLVLLISGISLIGITATGLIPNKQYHSNSIKLSALQLTPTEYTFFNAIFDEKDSIHIHIYTWVVLADTSLDMMWTTHKSSNISLYFRDSENVTLRQEEIYTKSHPITHDGDVYELDIFFQAQKYDKYTMSVTYVAWWERTEYESGNPMRFWNLPSTPIETWLYSDIEVQKASPNFTYIISGVVVLSIGVVLIPVSFVKKLR